MVLVSGFEARSKSHSNNTLLTGSQVVSRLWHTVRLCTVRMYMLQTSLIALADPVSLLLLPPCGTVDVKKKSI